MVEAILSIQDELNRKTKKIHVIDNNKTWWNSTYLMINRVFCFWRRIEKFYFTKFSKEKNFLRKDILSKNNWDKLKILKNLYYFFYSLTICLQSNNKTELYGSAWKCLMAINIVKKYFKKVKAEHAKGWQTRFLSIAIHIRLSLTQKYYKFVTENLPYIAAIVFNPTQK